MIDGIIPCCQGKNPLINCWVFTVWHIQCYVCICFQVHLHIQRLKIIMTWFLDDSVLDVSQMWHFLPVLASLLFRLIIYSFLTCFLKIISKLLKISLQFQKQQNLENAPKWTKGLLTKIRIPIIVHFPNCLNSKILIRSVLRKYERGLEKAYWN